MKLFFLPAILAALALSAAALTKTASAGDLKVVDCNGFDLVYDDRSPNTKCFTVEDSGVQVSTKVDRIVVVTSSYELIFTYVAGGHRTYLPIETLQKQVDNAKFFSDTDAWLPERKYDGFDIAVFSGTVKDGEPPVNCAIFARYSGEPGNYEFDGGPGYKNLAQGLYCALSGDAVLMNPPDNFYRVVETVIGKLHMPN
jgi:hypothetical protein